MRLQLLLVFLGSFVGTTAMAQPSGRLSVYQESKMTVGAAASVEVCYAPGQEALVKKSAALVWNRLDRITSLMNIYDEKSDLSRLNRAGGASLRIDDELYFFLKMSADQHRRTAGTFDISVGPLSALWKRCSNENRVPSRSEIAAAKSALGPERIVFEGNGRVRLVPGMTLDVNGDVQGYAADQAADILKASGFFRFLVDTGGELVAGGLGCSGRPWRVGVKDPFEPGVVREVLELKDQGVSTSGSYEHYFEIRGERWSHIINPVTGYPIRNVAGVTVVAPTALEADIWTKPLFVLGPDRGILLLKNQGKGYEGVVYSTAPDGEARRTSTTGYDAMLIRK